MNPKSILINPIFIPKKHTIESYKQQNRNAIKRRNIRKKQKKY